ncbi:MAG: hypothetical protein K5765_07050 [Clostridia bacterium]|nr:hypothetical protein [Clostridia bacterium]
MSRLFATYLMNINNIEPDRLYSYLSEQTIQARYLLSKHEFEFKVLDFYSYLSDKQTHIIDVKIFEPDLLRMMKIDSYSDDEKNELYYHKLLTEYEQINLDDDTFWGISILQYFFHVSKALLKRIKRQNHLFKLYRVDTKWVTIPIRQLHSNGGRPIGSLTKLTEADLQNLENQSDIIRNCVIHDWYTEYMELSRLLVRVRTRTETSALLTLTAAKWKFYILRYKWKLENGYINKNMDYENKLIEMNRKYSIFKDLSF